MSLVIEPLESSANQARLLDFVWRGAGFDFAEHERANGELVLVRSYTRERDGLIVRVVDRYFVGDHELVALDRTRFEISADRFAETAQFQAGTGNLHARPIELPGVLHLDEPHAPLPGVDAHVRLTYVGRVGLTLGDTRTEVTAMCLVAEQNGQQRAQWSASGVGEVAIGMVDQPLMQWLRAWTGGERTLLRGVSAELLARELQNLPGGDSTPHDSLF